MVAMTRSAALLKCLSSSIAVKPTPSKVHLHRPIPDAAFPKGYLLTGMHCGIKRDTQALDLGLILSTSKRPTAAAASFTQNAFKAAPVLVSQDVITQGGGRARSVVISSGCANAVTGPNGVRDAMAMSKAADVLHENKGDGYGALVMSTGVIGVPLPIDNILTGINSIDLQNHTSSLGSGFDAWERTARAFMTTDTFPKVRARTFTINGVKFRIAGIDKGAGMLHPVMGPPSAPHATLLACILTDAPIAPRCLQSALNYAVERSFNSISVDGDMSTNDTVFVLANGAAVDCAEMEEIDSQKHPDAYKMFRTELTALAVELAQLLVRDGEGATKFVTISVEGAATHGDAHKVASRISTSALVKTAFFGEDANWGRILCAAGSLPLSTPVIPSQVNVSFLPSDGSKPLPLLVAGNPVGVDEVRAKEILEKDEFGVKVELGLGKEAATYWTCDLSHEYVKINGSYRS